MARRWHTGGAATLLRSRGQRGVRGVGERNRGREKRGRTRRSNRTPTLGAAPAWQEHSRSRRQQHVTGRAARGRARTPTFPEPNWLSGLSPLNSSPAEPRYCCCCCGAAAWTSTELRPKCEKKKQKKLQMQQQRGTSGNMKKNHSGKRVSSCREGAELTARFGSFRIGSVWNTSPSDPGTKALTGISSRLLLWRAERPLSGTHHFRPSK